MDVEELSSEVEHNEEPEEGQPVAKKKRARRAKHAKETNGVAEVKKPKRKAKEPKESKGKKARRKPKESAKNLTDKGLPMRPSYNLQIGIRVSPAEREAIIEGCKADGHFSMSNYVRSKLGFAALR